MSFKQEIQDWVQVKIEELNNEDIKSFQYDKYYEDIPSYSEFKEGVEEALI